jgi:hypothetical protein
MEDMIERERERGRMKKKTKGRRKRWFFDRKNICKRGIFVIEGGRGGRVCEEGLE